MTISRVPQSIINMVVPLLLLTLGLSFGCSNVSESEEDTLLGQKDALPGDTSVPEPTDLKQDLTSKDRIGEELTTPDLKGADGTAQDLAEPDLKPREVKPEIVETVGKGVVLTLDLHQAPAGKVFVNLHTMETSGEEPSFYDFLMAKIPPCPQILLGKGVTALNLGAHVAFDEVEEAPETGYLADSPGKPVIGSTWKSGGSGATGFQMSGNVYVLHLADGTYAKIEVLSAKQGVIEILAYHQPDGSRNLKTANSE